MELLNKIQRELKVNKGRWNDFGKFYYRSAVDILTAYKEIQEDSIVTASYRPEIIGDWNYIIAVVTYKHGDFELTVEAPAREEEIRPKMSPPMLSGSSVSFSLKYALCGLFGLDDEVDPDSLENKKAPKKAPPAPPRATAADEEDPIQGRTMIADRVKLSGYEIGFGEPDDDAFTEWAGKAIHEMTAQECRNIWKTLDKFTEFMKGTK